MIRGSNRIPRNEIEQQTAEESPPELHYYHI
jgi:hypothetical protein